MLISETEVTALGHATYTMRSLMPAKHRIWLRPGPGNSAAWAVEFEFEVKPDYTQFVAIRNQNQPGRDSVAAIFVPGYMDFVPVPGSVKAFGRP